MADGEDYEDKNSIEYLKKHAEWLKKVSRE
jgi:hypothetical protein